MFNQQGVLTYSFDVSFLQLHASTDLKHYAIQYIRLLLYGTPELQMIYVGSKATSNVSQATI